MSTTTADPSAVQENSDFNTLMCTNTRTPSFTGSYYTYSKISHENKKACQPHTQQAKHKKT